MTERGSQVRQEWPLVGRRDELARCAKILRESPDDGLYLSGPAGVGKTRLAREIERLGTAAGMRVKWVTATRAAARMPFGAFAHLLGAFGAYGRATPDGPVTPEVQYVALARDAILAADGDARVLLVVDDAHRLDPASAMLLHDLAAQHGVSVCVTVREDEAVEADAVSALWREGLLTRIDLRRFTDSETAALLEAVLGGPASAETSVRLIALASGNALLLRELVHAAIDERQLVEASGVPQARRRDRAPRPSVPWRHRAGCRADTRRR